MIEPRAASVELQVAGIRVATYVHESDVAALESPKPYLHPVRTLAGEVVTLRRPHDHVWHSGLAWALPVVGDENFWGGPTFVRDRGYVQLPNNGRMRTRALDATQTGLRHELDWVTQRGDTVFDESRRIDVRALPDERAWALLFSTSMRNVSGGPIRLGSPTTEGRPDAGYGGLFWRGPRSFLDGAVHSPEGAVGEAARGRRHPWLGYSGRHDGSGATSTVVMVDGAGNPRHPTPWFVRSEEYAGMCPAPFFDEALVVEAGSTVRFDYAVVVADGEGGGGRTADLAAQGRAALEKEWPADHA